MDKITHRMMSFPHGFGGNPPVSVILSDLTSHWALLKEKETLKFVSCPQIAVFLQTAESNIFFVQIEKYFREAFKHAAVRFITPIFLLVSMLLNGCVQSTNTVLQEVSTTGSGDPAGSLVEYRDTELGFSFSLPAGWEGFTVQTSQWEGLKSADQGDKIVEQGPIVSIDHPQSTAEQPRQEIPIMVFTTAQWDRMQAGAWHVGAAPISPLELGRNSRYVFALPARYNYAFLDGWQEVEQILQENPLRAFEPSSIP